MGLSTIQLIVRDFLRDFRHIAKKSENAIEIIDCVKLEMPSSWSECKWRLKAETPGVWKTDCSDTTFTFKGLPSENHLLFCPLCGLRIIED